MPANRGFKTMQTAARPPRYDAGSKRVALSVRLDRAIHEKAVENAELNSRSVAAEVEFQLRKIYK